MTQAIETLSSSQAAVARAGLGVGTPTVFGAERLKRWQAWKVLRDYRYDMACIGDSFTAGNYFHGKLRDLLLAESYPDGGPGWCGFGWAGASKVLRNSSIDLPELDYDLNESDWTNVYGTGGHGAAVEHLVAAAVDKVLTLTAGTALSAVQVLFFRSGTKPLFQIGSDGYQTLVNAATEYGSRFDLGVDGFTAYGGSFTGNVDSVGGRNNCLKLTCDTSTGEHMYQRGTTTTSGISYTLSYEIFIPTGSALTHVESRSGGSIGSQAVTLDTWTTVSTSFTATATYVRMRLGIAGNFGSITTAATDIAYIRNVMVVENTPLTAIGMGSIDTSASGSSFTVSLKSASNTTTLLGAVGRTTTSNALCIHKLGSSGGNAGMFAASTYWEDSVALLSPKGAMIMFATNEQTSGTTPTTYAANIQSIIDKLRVITPTIDILLCCPGPTKYGNTAATTYSLSDYRDALWSLAVLNNTAFVDFSSVIGPWSASLVTDTFTHADEVHPGTRGKELYANVLRRIL